MATRTPVQRLLLRDPPPLYRPLCAHHRPFSQSSRAGAGVRKSNSFQPQQPQMKQPAQKSLSVMKNESKQAIDRMPNDVGLIPGTFVMPTGARLPNLFEQPAARWKLEKFRAWQRIKETFARYFMWVMYIRPRPDFQTARIPSIAKSLYENMYTSFASGNLRPMEQSLCENIYQKLDARIANRPANTTLEWKLHQYTSKPRVVSHKYIPMPVGDREDKTKQTVIQQCVVRISSVQTLKRIKRVKTREGRVEQVVDEGSSDKPKEVTEYLVVQRLMKRGKQGDWMIWGTTDESTLADV